jgi:NAD(P)-dependent dehydrogenase (short-subunit alcohol dehydrogenase family)
MIYLQNGVIQGTLTALKYMDKSKGGKGGTVINTGSVAGLGKELKSTPMYNATKHAVVGFSQAIGVRIGMRINVFLLLVK